MVRWVAASLTLTLLAACNGGGGEAGGGGGGGSTSPPINSGGPWVAYTPPMAPPGTDPETLGMGGLVMVNALSAYGEGLTGAGETIAIVDTGIDTDHGDFAGRISSASIDIHGRGLNNTDCGATIQGECAHGTRVAGIAAAARNSNIMHGIAYEATIMAIRADNSCATGCRFSDSDLAAAINHAVANNADVINLSLGGGGPPSTTLRNALLNATNNGVILVFAAGNSSGSSPEYPGAVATDPDFNGRILIAGAVNDDGDPTSFTNFAGTAAYHYIMAPGEDLTTTDGNGLFISGRDGTSYATPLIAGAIVLLMDQGLTADQAVSRLLATASDIGPAGVDDVAGRGILNLETALAPAGTTSLTGPSGATVPIDTTTLSVSSVMSGGSLARALSQVVVTDTLDRFYRADASHTVGAVASAPTAAAFGASVHQQQSIARTGSGQVALGYTDSRLGEGEGLAGTDGLDWLRMSGRGPAGSLVSVGVNDSALLGFRGGSVGSADAPIEVFRPPVPHALLVDNPLSTEIAIPFGADGWIGTYAATSLDPEAEEPWMADPRANRATLIGIDAGRRLDDATAVSLSLGVLLEDGSVLGTRGEGAFADLGQASTGFAGAALSRDLGGGVVLDLSVAAGMTEVSGDDGALGGFDEMLSLEARAGLSMTDLLTGGDRAGIGIARQLALGSGTAELRLATGVSTGGSPVIGGQVVSLAPESEPLEATIFYALPLGEGSLRFDGVIAHDDFGTEGYAGLRYHLPLD